MKSSRAWSLSLGACSLVLPAALFAYRHLQFRNQAALQAEPYICGMPLLAALLLCFAISFLLSLSALLLGLEGYLQLARPRASSRLVELLVTALPAVAMASIFVVAWALD